MPGGGRSGLAAATGPDGRIYAIGGYDGTNVLSRVEAYDTVSNTWSTMASMPGGAREGVAAAMGPDGRIHGIGGDDGTNNFSRVEAYNTTTNTWTSAQAMAGGARTFVGAATGPDGRIYAIGGYPGGPFTSLVEAYTTIGGTVSSSGTSITAVEGTTLSAVTVARFSDADQNTSPATYSASINWGDTTTSAGVVTGSRSSGFAVSGSHMGAEEGSYTITVSINDLDGNGTTATGSATVADGALTAAGLNLKQSHDGVSGVVASFVDGDPGGTVSDYTANISWGDGTSSTGTIASSGSAFTVLGTHHYNRDKEKATIKITIRDAGGSQATAVTITKE
jgi:hypothetical protein